MANLLKEALGGMLTFRHRINECICWKCLVYFPKQFVKHEENNSMFAQQDGKLFAMAGTESNT